MVCGFHQTDVQADRDLGYSGQRLIGSGAVLWDARAAVAQGKMTNAQLMRDVATSAPR
jgi:dihydroxy-acid dehydratase